MQSLFLSPAGRLGPRTFLIAAVALIVAALAVGLVPILGQAAGLALLWPWWCVASKRLHDMGRSARPAIVVMLANAVVGTGAAALSLSAFAGAASLAFLPVLAVFGVITVFTMVGSLAFLVWLALSGSDGANAYGPQPEDVGLAALRG